MCVAMNPAHVARCVAFGTRCVARVAHGEVRGARRKVRGTRGTRGVRYVISLGYSTV